MPIINRIAEFEADMTAWRRHLHAIPELDFDLHETAAFVAARLREIGVDELHEGIATTGIVALIHGAEAGPTIGLRADMDALPIEEAVDRPWRSQRPGRMHACGHDGHTAMLLGAARYLAETRNFAGTVALIFQPSEEMSGGAELMVAEGIMERFGVASVFALHNAPGFAFGRIETRPGVLMAATDQFRVTLTGRGGHAAMPHDCVDPIAAAVALAQAFYAIPARRVDPLANAVLSLTVIRSGTASNVIPDAATLEGTVRTLDPILRDRIASEIATAVEAVALAHGVTGDLDYEFGYPVTRNDPEQTELAIRVAEDIVGGSGVDGDRRPEMGAEDFAYMLEARPGSYVFLGAGPGAGLHHPGYDFNDAISPIGASYFARLVETALPIRR